VSFDADPSSAQRDLFQIQPRLFTTQLSCVSRDKDNIDQIAKISIRYSNQDIHEIRGAQSLEEIDDQLRASLAYALELDENSLSELREDCHSAQPVGCLLKHFLPERIISEIDTIAEDARAITLALQENEHHSMRFRRRKEMDILLSEEIIAVLREVLEDIIDFDKTFKNQDDQELSLNSESETLTWIKWYEKLHSLPRQKRINIIQTLQEDDTLFDRIYEVMKKDLTKGKSEHLGFINQRIPSLIAEASWYLDNFFASSLKYLGPLRDAPKPLYPLAPAADPNEVGLRGEYTASILELHKNKKISYIPSENFKESIVNRNTVTRTLEAAVIDWLQYLGVATSVRSRDQGKLGHELKVKLANSDTAHDLTHVGVGVSQVLPILVMCLLADTDSTLVFEQPELHLHPKVQTLLGDFFLSMALCNKQCIVETHSEYLIDRLRFRIAAASPEKELNSQVKIYFVEKPSQSSSFREVVINEYGAISDWPEGFFDQSQQQAEDILRAATIKRKANRRSKDG
jgi:predicted ATPase